MADPGVSKESRVSNEQIPRKEEPQSISQIERVMSEDGTKKDHLDFERVDKEIAKYADPSHIVHITPEENRRLKRLIDKRVLSVMIFTYFLQALDKGTMSFTSIMGILDDNSITDKQFPWLTTCIYIAILIVEYPINWTIQRIPIAKGLGIAVIIWGTILGMSVLVFWPED